MSEKGFQHKEQYEKPEIKKEGELRDITSGTGSPINGA
jgi:hypothetical protein